MFKLFRKKGFTPPLKHYNYQPLDKWLNQLIGKLLQNYNPAKFLVRGFTLVEVLIAIFIFSLAMTTLAAIFVRMDDAYLTARAIQKDLEAAQQSMSLMAKTLRTSSIVSCGGTADCSSVSPINQIEIYDYSQSQCIVYRFNSSNNRLMAGRSDPWTPGDISTCDFSTTRTPLTPMVSSFMNDMDFDVVQSQSSPDRVGRITISMEICPRKGCGTRPVDRVRVQSSVSLRDYAVSKIE